MPNSAFHTALSRPRYLRYLSACGNRRKAVMLYRSNIDLSLKIFSVIGVLEVILRNSIDRYMISQKGPLWIEDAVAPGGYLETHPECEKSFHSVHEAIHTLGLQYCHDSLIAKLGFGFWRHQFALKEFAASNCNLMEVFTNRPPRISKNDIYKRLSQVNIIRNRIAHHEPICFYRNTISTASVEKRYNTILELLIWLGCNPRRILYGIDRVRKSINAINAISHSINNSSLPLSQ